MWMSATRLPGKRSPCFAAPRCVQLYKGAVRVSGRRSPVSLYSEALASFDDAGEADSYDQRDATGFIRLQGLRLTPRPR